ncbi:hypothetical protein GS579_08520, partial [Rhodococcus hoagii]|nr:hypothetical protein [Prescottella equi]
MLPPNDSLAPASVRIFGIHVNIEYVIRDVIPNMPAMPQPTGERHGRSGACDSAGQRSRGGGAADLLAPAARIINHGAAAAKPSSDQTADRDPQS